jgi:hypothetical protein
LERKEASAPRVRLTHFNPLQNYIVARIGRRNGRSSVSWLGVCRGLMRPQYPYLPLSVPTTTRLARRLRGRGRAVLEGVLDGLLERHHPPSFPCLFDGGFTENGASLQDLSIELSEELKTYQGKALC